MRTFARTSILVVAAGLAAFIALRAVAPLEPRAQHTVRLCVDRPPVATKLFRSQQFLSGGEVVAVFTLPTSGWTRCRARGCVDDQDLYTIVITTYIPPRQVGDGPWTPWYADYYHPEV